MGSYLAICALPEQQRQKAEEANWALHSTLSILAVWQCVPMPTSASTKGMGFTSTKLAISLMSCFFNWDTHPVLLFLEHQEQHKTCAAGQQSDTQWLSTHHKQKKIISADPLHYSPCCWQLQSYWHLGNLKSNLHLVNLFLSRVALASSTFNKNPVFEECFACSCFSASYGFSVWESLQSHIVARSWQIYECKGKVCSDLFQKLE